MCPCRWRRWKSPGSKIGVHVRVQDRIRILLNACWLGGTHTLPSPLVSTRWQANAACTLTRTVSCAETHTDTQARAPWWVSSNPARALAPGESCVGGNHHTYMHTQTLILSHLGPAPNPILTLIPDQCLLLKGAWNQQGNRWIYAHRWSTYSWGSSRSK